MALLKKISRSSFQLSKFRLLLFADWTVSDPRGLVGPLDGLHRFVDGVPRRFDLRVVQWVNVTRQSCFGRCQNASRSSKPGPIERLNGFRRFQEDGRGEKAAGRGLDEVPSDSAGRERVACPVNRRFMSADPALPAPGMKGRAHQGGMGLRVFDAAVGIDASS